MYVWKQHYIGLYKQRSDRHTTAVSICSKFNVYTVLRYYTATLGFVVYWDIRLILLLPLIRGIRVLHTRHFGLVFRHISIVFLHFGVVF